MRIGIDIRCLMEKNYSGISEYTYNLLNHLFLNDSKNKYVLFYNSAKESKVPRFEFSNVEYREFQYPNKLFNLSIRFLKIASIDKLIGGVDVFIVPNFLFLNLSSQCKKLVIVHDLSFELFPEFFTFKKRLWHKLIGPRKIVKEADKVVAISENTKRDLIDFYKTKSAKIEVIYPGINEIYFNEVSSSKSDEVRAKYNLPENYIFYLGNLEPRKNVESLISAFNLTKSENLHLVLAGSKAWKYSNIEKLVKKSSKSEKIHFLGYVDKDDKPALYKQASVFVYPSLYEGFGLPPLEAMASGTAVICSNNSSLIEAVDLGGLLIDTYNINEISKAIENVLSDANLRSELIVEGKKQAQKFKWKNTSERIITILNSMDYENRN